MTMLCSMGAGKSGRLRHLKASRTIINRANVFILRACIVDMLTILNISLFLPVAFSNGSCGA